MYTLHIAAQTMLSEDVYKRQCEQNVIMTFLFTAYPESDPEIHGVQSSYHEGDYVAVNCTASPSYPPANLDWYINGIKVRLFQCHSKFI